MRVLKPQSKNVRKVAIPKELQESMREVHERIHDSARDPSIDLAFDDAIQVNGICGGRYGEESRPYVLTYYPSDDSKRGRWFLTLHETEIEDLADGCICEITMHCCTAADCRSKFREKDGRCFYCDYADDAAFGTFSFPKAIEKLKDRGVSSLTEASFRADVVNALGNPGRSGGGITHEILGYIPPWITYQRADCQLRFEFGPDERIRTITVLERDWGRGK